MLNFSTSKHLSSNLFHCTAMGNYFDGCTGRVEDVLMVANPLDDTKKTPQPQMKKALKTMLVKYCEGKKTYGEPNTWDVTRVTDMSMLFMDMKTFNAPIDQWNTSEVTNMRSMFNGAS